MSKSPVPLFSWLATLACLQNCAPSRCPPETRQVGTQCITTEDARPVPDQEREGAADAGQLASGEASSAASDDEARGSVCGPECWRPTCTTWPCTPPEAPRIQGARSMAPERVAWRWTVAEDVTRVEGRLDGRWLELTNHDQLAPTLSPGLHTLALRACNDFAQCSSWVEHEAIVEDLTRDAPRGLHDATRPRAESALGRAIVLGHALSVDDGALTPEDVARSVALGADLVVLAATDLGALASLLDAPALRASDALVVLDLDGLTEAPEDLARRVFDLLDGRPELARNGRPVWLRTSLAGRALLAALAQEAPLHAVTGPYARRVLADHGEPELAAELAGESTIVDLVTVDVAAPDLLERVERAWQEDRALIVDARRATDGVAEALLATLRHHVDGWITSAAPARARAVVTASNIHALLDARVPSETGSLDYLHGSDSGPRFGRLESTFGLVLPTLRDDTPAGPLLELAPGVGFFVSAGRPAVSVGGLALYWGTLSGEVAGDASDVLVASERLGIAWTSEGFRVQVKSDASSGQSAILRLALEDLTCAGAQLTKAALAQGTHWIVAFTTDGSAWSVVVDGRCAALDRALAPLVSGDSGVFLAHNRGSELRATSLAGVLDWPVAP